MGPAKSWISLNISNVGIVWKVGFNFFLQLSLQTSYEFAKIKKKIHENHTNLSLDCGIHMFKSFHPFWSSADFFQNKHFQKIFQEYHKSIKQFGSQSFCFFSTFVALRPKSTAMVMGGRSVHLTTLFPGQA